MEFVRVDDAGDGVCAVRLDRPPVNALSNELLAELTEVVDGLRADESVKALVVWGGDSVFAAGADVEKFRPVDASTARGIAAAFRSAGDALATFPRPTIAAMYGYAIGGGLELALACDFRIAGDNCRMGFAEISLGIIPGGGGTQRAARLVGPARAKDLIFSGRYIRTPEAVEIGLVDRSSHPDETYDAALGWARSLASGAVAAMGHAKAAIDGGLGLPLAAGLDLEADCFAATFETNDAERGITSFVENGPGKASFEGN